MGRDTRASTSLVRSSSMQTWAPHPSLQQLPVLPLVHDMQVTGDIHHNASAKYRCAEGSTPAVLRGLICPTHAPPSLHLSNKYYYYPYVRAGQPSWNGSKPEVILILVAARPRLCG